MSIYPDLHQTALWNDEMGPGSCSACIPLVSGSNQKGCSGPARYSQQDFQVKNVFVHALQNDTVKRFLIWQSPSLF